MMKYDFDKIIDRSNTSSVKWDGRENMFGTQEVIPMWVADMDFEAPPGVIEALKKRIDHKVFGYTFESEDYFSAIINWFEKRHGWKIRKDWISYTGGVIPGLSFSVQAFTEPGDEVIVQPPVYRPFYNSISQNKRTILRNALVQEGNQYHMDPEDLKEKISDKTKLFFLCNPHNPAGKVWKKQELETIGRICLENDILIVSDEIHFDIAYSGHPHTPIATLSEELAKQTITLTSPAKTFNLQGLQSAYAVISNDSLRRRFDHVLSRSGIFMNNTLSIEASKAAYGTAGEWLEQLLTYLEGNRDYLLEFIEREIPEINCFYPEGTYIAWLDCRKFSEKAGEPGEFFAREAGVGLIDGKEFGKEGDGFVRLNFACPRSRLEKALNQMKKAVKNIS